MAAITNKAVSEVSRAATTHRSPTSKRRTARLLQRDRRKTSRGSDIPADLETRNDSSESVDFEHADDEVHASQLPGNFEGFDDFAVAGGQFDNSDSGEYTPAKEQTSFLAMYFRDMAALDVLQPQEEFTAARQIERLEIDVWAEILGYAPVVEQVLGIIETCHGTELADFEPLRHAATAACKDSSKTAQKNLSKLVRPYAERIRTLDTDKLYLEAVLAELRRLQYGTEKPITSPRSRRSPKNRMFSAYLAKVDVAERAAWQARNEFVKANLRLVVSIARRFNHGRMALADLIQEGNLGLMKAVERYDYRRGFRFSTYASWWIRHAISRALADKGREVRLPVHMIDAHHRLSKAKRELTTKLGRQPTNEELAEATQMPPERVEKMRAYLIDQSFSLDRPVNDEDGRSFVEFLEDPSSEENSPTEALAMQTLTDEVRQMLLELKPIEADILRQRFGFDNDEELTLKQIGEKYNLSRERIRQLQEQALTKMRRALQRKEMM